MGTIKHYGSKPVFDTVPANFKIRTNKFKGEAKLDFDRLATITEKLEAEGFHQYPIVLHGASHGQDAVRYPALFPRLPRPPSLSDISGAHISARIWKPEG